MSEEPEKISKNRRTTQAIEESDRLIEMMLDEGHSPASISALLAKNYGIKQRQVFKDIQRIRQTRQAILNPDTMLTNCSDIKHKADYIYRKALQNGDLQTALKSQEVLLKTLHFAQKGGHYAPGNHHTARHSPSTRLEEIVRALHGDGKTD